MTRLTRLETDDPSNERAIGTADVDLVHPETGVWKLVT